VATRASRLPIFRDEAHDVPLAILGSVAGAPSPGASPPATFQRERKVQNAKPLLLNSLRASFLQTRNLTRRSMGTVVLPETIGYIPCAKNPTTRFPRPWRESYMVQRSPLSLAPRGNGRKNISKSS